MLEKLPSFSRHTTNTALDSDNYRSQLTREMPINLNQIKFHKFSSPMMLLNKIAALRHAVSGDAIQLTSMVGMQMRRFIFQDLPCYRHYEHHVLHLSQPYCFRVGSGYLAMSFFNGISILRLGILGWQEPNTLKWCGSPAKFGYVEDLR